MGAGKPRTCKTRSWLEIMQKLDSFFGLIINLWVRMFALVRGASQRFTLNDCIIQAGRRQAEPLPAPLARSPLCLDLRHNDGFPNKEASSLHFCSPAERTLQPCWGAVRERRKGTPITHNP